MSPLRGLLTDILTTLTIGDHYVFYLSTWRCIIRNSTSALLQKQLQNSFVKSGLSTKQFFDWILANKPNVFDSSVTFELIGQDSTVHINDPDDEIKATANLPFYGDDWANCYYMFHVPLKAHNNDKIDSIACFSCTNGYEWSCKF